MSDELIGKSLGVYRIERLLGRGGMGAVYEGVDTRDGRRVAVKVMTRTLGEDRELVSRFEREARVASQTHHPNVARVMDSGASDDVRYLVMEFIDGRSLADILREKKFLVGRRAVDFIRQTADGLQAALAQGSIHRDIKPENLMVTSDDTIKIVDFGLAKNESGDSFKTATGAVMGTPHYMSPEQATGRPVDHRSDIYSLGATFYHMLTGHTPFNGENAFAILQKHVSTEPPAVTKWNSNVPEPVCKVVYRMMSKHPDERFQTYQHLIGVLDDVIAGRTAHSMTMEVVEENAPAPASAAAVPLALDSKRLIKIGGAVMAVVLLALMVHYIKNEFFSSPPMPNPQQAQKKQDVFETGKASLRNFKEDTVPMIAEIRKATREQDDEVRNFGSRRARDNEEK